jgi:MFS family permease
MNKVVQIILTAALAVAAFYVSELLLRISGLFGGYYWLIIFLSVALALLLGFAMWQKFQSDGHNLFTRVFQGAFFVGGVAFLAGIVGPIIFTPDANQGPMLGIFVTGPLGTIFGAIGGFIYWFVMDRKSNTPTA